MPFGFDLRDNRMIEFFARAGNKVWIDGMDLEPYAPLREPDLLGQFLHLFGREQLPSDAKVIRFYARYGPVRERVLVEGERLPAWALRLEPEDQERLCDQARLCLCEPLWWLRESAQELRLTYDIYLALKEKRLTYLRSFVADLPPEKRVRELQIVAGKVVRETMDAYVPSRGKTADSPPVRPRSQAERKGSRLAWRIQVDEACVRLATGLLANQLNKAEAKSRRHWTNPWQAVVDLEKDRPLGDWRPESLQLVRARTVDDLVAAMYLLLGELVAQGTALRHCPGCGRLFHPRRTNQEYCDARCGDAARQRLHYRRPDRPNS
jgi:hypothetical protein